MTKTNKILFSVLIVVLVLLIAWLTWTYLISRAILNEVPFPRDVINENYIYSNLQIEDSINELNLSWKLDTVCRYNGVSFGINNSSSPFDIWGVNSENCTESDSIIECNVSVSKKEFDSGKDNVAQIESSGCEGIEDEHITGSAVQINIK